jgi:hypothetical protein
MKRASNLKSMSMEELWSLHPLHQLITSFLTRKNVAEKPKRGLIDASIVLS